MTPTRLVLFSLVSIVITGNAWSDDWPQWLGLRRDSVWRETGIVESIPEKGLPVSWRVPVGYGYGGPAVADGKVYAMDYRIESGEISNNPGSRTRLEGKERILCFELESGDLVWQHSYDRPYAISYAGGPRCTPTVEGGKVYALGAEGNLTCLDADNGDVVWERDLVADYDTPTPIWGFSSHPLVDGDLLYCVVGGEGSVAVAFNKNTGREVWKALSAREPGYCPPTMITHAGVKQLLIWHPETINGLDPQTGEVYWTLPLQPSYEMSITVPRKQGDYLYASGIGNVSALMKLDGGKPAAEIVWRGKAKNSVYCSNSTPILDGEMIYGCDIDTGALVGARIEDGERLWETHQPTREGRRPRHATAFLVKHEDRYFMFNETGDLILAKLAPEGYEELGRFHVLEPTNEAFGREVVWSHPAFAEKSMIVRNDTELVRVDLAGR